MSLAGLLAVMLSQPDEEPRTGPPHVGGYARRTMTPRTPLRRGSFTTEVRTRR